MDFSWPLLPDFSVNGGTPKQSFLGSYCKMHLPSASDMCDFMRQDGRGCYLYSAHVARAYRKLPLDPADWPLVSFSFKGVFYIDISLPFGLW